MRCDPPEQPEHTEIIAQSTEHNVGATIMYRCVQGYEHISGTLTIICKPNNVWLPPSPVCERELANSLISML